MGVFMGGAIDSRLTQAGRDTDTALAPADAGAASKYTNGDGVHAHAKAHLDAVRTYIHDAQGRHNE
jgi:hypothetical protein